MRRSLTPASVACTVVGLVLLWLAQLEGRQYRSSLTPLYAYLPEGQEFYVHSPRMEVSLRLAAHHLRGELLDAVTQLGGNSEDEISNFLGRKCIRPSIQTVLPDLGLKPDGEALVARFAGWEDDTEYLGDVYLASFAIESRERVLEMLARIQTEGEEMQLVYGSESEGRQLEIWREDGHGRGTLCNPVTGEVIGQEPTRISRQVESLALYPHRDQQGAVEVRCRVLEREGKGGRGSGEGTDSHGYPCGATAPEGAHGEPKEPEVGQEKGDDDHIVAFPGITGVWFAFPEEDLITISNSKALLGKALEASTERLRYRADGGGTRRLYELRKRDATPYGEIASGSFSSIMGRGARDSAYLLHGGKDYVEVFIDQPIPKTGLRVLELMKSSVGTSRGGLLDLEDTNLGVRIQSDYTMDYVRFVFSYLHGVRDELQNRIGPLTPVLEKLLQEQFSSLDVYDVGVRNGVPLVVMGIGVADAATASRTVLRLQRAFRSGRDRRILTRAIGEYAKRYPENVIGDSNVIGEVSKPSAGVLHEEPNPSWASYVVREGKVVEQDDLPVSLFAAERVGREEEQIEVHYILPEVTSNDVKFNDEWNGLSEGVRTRLLRGEVRVVAHYEESEGRLWMAVDVATLQELRGKMEGRQTHEEFRRDLERARDQGTKMGFNMKPSWILTTGWRNDPEFLEDEVPAWFKGLERYERVSGTVASNGKEDGVFIRIRFDRRI